MRLFDWDPSTDWAQKAWDVFTGLVIFLLVLWLIARGGQFLAEWITDWREARG